MRAYEYIDLAFPGSIYDIVGLPGGLEPIQHFDCDGEICKTLIESPAVLNTQNSGRDKNRNLLAAFDSLKSRPHRNFSFAVTNIAAKKPVHRQRFLHIGFYLLN
jgi:hypothetical protein